MDEITEEMKHSHNWFKFAKFYEFISSFESFTKFAEIGVWKGRSISFLANLVRDRKNLEIYGIDLFNDTYTIGHEPANKPPYKNDVKYLWEIYNENLNDTNTRHLIQDIKGLSHEMAERFSDNYFDFVFIDADHSYDSVKKDIDSWFSKVKQGGIIAGHDYLDKDPNDGVTKAVDEKFRNKHTSLNIIPIESVWWVLKK